MGEGKKLSFSDRISETWHLVGWGGGSEEVLEEGTSICVGDSLPCTAETNATL